MIDLVFIKALLLCWLPGMNTSGRNETLHEKTQKLIPKHHPIDGKIEVFAKNEKRPILTQIVQPAIRPYIHPMLAPEGKGILTEFQRNITYLES